MHNFVPSAPILSHLSTFTYVSDLLIHSGRMLASVPNSQNILQPSESSRLMDPDHNPRLELPVCLTNSKTPDASQRNTMHNREGQHVIQTQDALN